MIPLKTWQKRALKNASATGMSRLTREFRCIAMHEAAHAVVGKLLGMNITLINIMVLDDPRANGYVNFADAKSVPPMNDAIMSMAGAVAELLYRDGNATFDAKFFRYIGGKTDFESVRAKTDGTLGAMTAIAETTMKMVESNYDVILNVADVLANKLVMDANELNGAMA